MPKRLTFSTFTLLIAGFGFAIALLTTGCEPAEEEVVVEETKPAPPQIQENGRLNLQVDGQKQQVFYAKARVLDKGASFPDTLVIYGKDVELYGEFDVNEDGEATAEDQLAESLEITAVGDAMLNTPLLLRSNPPRHEPRVILPDLGMMYLVSGKIIPQQYSPPAEGQAAQWNGTVELVLEDEEGEEHQVYGDIQGTLMTGEPDDRVLRRFRVLADAEAEAADQQQAAAEGDAPAPPAP